MSAIAVPIFVSDTAIAQTGQTGVGQGTGQTGVGQGISFTLTNPLGANKTPEEIIKGIISYVRTLGLIIAPLMYVWGAFLMLTAGGDAKKVGIAKQLFLWTTIGIAVLLVAEGLVIVVQDLFA